VLSLSDEPITQKMGGDTGRSKISLPINAWMLLFHVVGMTSFILK
jgi:hypothetical protein